MARILTITLNPALDLTVRLRQLELGAVNRSEAVLTQAAGKGLNVAQVLADLGHTLSVGGFLGRANAAPFETAPIAVLAAAFPARRVHGFDTFTGVGLSNGGTEESSGW